MCLDPALAFFITLSHGGLRVNPSIHLNHQLMLRTVEIQNKRLHGVLSPKTHPLKLATTQCFPENALRRSAFPAKLTSACHKLWGGMAIPMTGCWNHCKIKPPPVERLAPPESYKPGRIYFPPNPLPLSGGDREERAGGGKVSGGRENKVEEGNRNFGLAKDPLGAIQSQGFSKNVDC